MCLCIVAHTVLFTTLLFLFYGTLSMERSRPGRWGSRQSIITWGTRLVEVLEAVLCLRSVCNEQVFGLREPPNKVHVMSAQYLVSDASAIATRVPSWALLNPRHSRFSRDWSCPSWKEHEVDGTSPGIPPRWPPQTRTPAKPVGYRWAGLGIPSTRRRGTERCRHSFRIPAPCRMGRQDPGDSGQGVFVFAGMAMAVSAERRGLLLLTHPCWAR